MSLAHHFFVANGQIGCGETAVTWQMLSPDTHAMQFDVLTWCAVRCIYIYVRSVCSSTFQSSVCQAFGWKWECRLIEWEKTRSNSAAPSTLELSDRNAETKTYCLMIWHMSTFHELVFKHVGDLVSLIFASISTQPFYIWRSKKFTVWNFTFGIFLDLNSMLKYFSQISSNMIWIRLSLWLSCMKWNRKLHTR